MAIANENAVKYAELTDEHIKDIKKNIEMFSKSEEYWDKFAHHSTVPRGHKTFTYRKLIAPKVNKQDIKPRAEFVAPRPTKMTVATFEKTVANYGDKAIYSREDLQYHFDDTVKNLAATLKELTVQKKNFVKGKAFFESRAIITPYTTGGLSILKTCEKAAIILRKNKAKRWDGTHYLAHITPEELNKLRDELTARGATLSEPTKAQLDSVATAVGSYGDFTFSVTTDDLMYKNATTQYIVFMGKRNVDGESPVDVSKLEGESDTEVINNGLGTGVLYDEDGNITADSNKQQGELAINWDGLGAAVSDDLCILDCEVSVDEIKGTELRVDEMTGYVSKSGNEVEITLSAGSNTSLSVTGGRHDSTANKDYANGSTIISVKVEADATYTLGSVTTANWSATYYRNKAESDADTAATSTANRKNAEILAIIEDDAANDTLIVRVPNNAYSFTIACAATASK